MCGRGGRRVGWFQLTAARRRLASSIDAKPTPFVVSTHSRPKAAGGFDKGQCLDFVKFQLTAARRRLGQRRRCMGGVIMFQLTAARRRLDNILPTPNLNRRFQLTAARRRLVRLSKMHVILIAFQLTAARRRLVKSRLRNSSSKRFNSQPPEGGW